MLISVVPVLSALNKSLIYATFEVKEESVMVSWPVPQPNAGFLNAVLEVIPKQVLKIPF